jgi:hypothetical protein
MAIKSREMPLDFLLRRMRDPLSAPADQFLAARSAAPFCHPVLQAVAHKYLDSHARPLAPVVKVVVMQVPREAPRLRNEGSDDDVP